VTEARDRTGIDELGRRAVALRRRGLQLDAIALRLGISPRRVAQLLRAAGIDPRACAIRYCAGCRRVLARGAAALRANEAAFCLECLARTPGVTFGQWLRAHRLAAGLTLRQLAERAGLDDGTVWAYEQDETLPRGERLARLVAVLGPGLARPQRGRRAVSPSGEGAAAPGKPAEGGPPTPCSGAPAPPAPEE
jgi:transcriptional regulator with XRE-family HTH domain